DWRGLEKLRSLRVTGIVLSKDNLSVIASLRKLEALELDYAVVGPASLDALKGLSELREISLTYSQGMLDPGILKALPRLEYLDLSNSGISSGARVFLSREQRLKHLCLARTDVDDAMVGGLSAAGAIEILDLREAGVTDRCIDALARIKNLRLL